MLQMRAHFGLDLILGQMSVHIYRTTQQLILTLGVEHYMIAIDGGVGLYAVYLPLVVADAVQLDVGHKTPTIHAISRERRDARATQGDVGRERPHAHVGHKAAQVETTCAETGIVGQRLGLVHQCRQAAV